VRCFSLVGSSFSYLRSIFWSLSRLHRSPFSGRVFVLQPPFSRRLSVVSLFPPTSEGSMRERNFPATPSQIVPAWEHFLIQRPLLPRVFGTSKMFSFLFPVATAFGHFFPLKDLKQQLPRSKMSFFFPTVFSHPSVL